MTLTSVVLPAPLGPIRPWVDPPSTSSDTPSTARTPPKCRWILSRRRSMGSSPTRPPWRPDDGQAAATDDALRAKDDHGDQERAGDDVDVDPLGLEDPRQQRDDQGADDRPEHVAASAEHGKSQDLHRARHAVLSIARINEEVQVRFKRAREAREDCAQDKRDHLVAHLNYFVD